MGSSGVTRNKVLKDIPAQISDPEVLMFLRSKNIDWKYVSAIKDLSDLNDEVISEWLNLSVKTLRGYRKESSTFKENTKEHVLLILTLLKHGTQAFGSTKAFETWLHTENFHFDNQRPEVFLNTITGIRFVDERLSAMEYGDNV